MNRCDQTCKYPCAKDHRTKAEKIAAMAAGATTPGEKAAAEAAMARHPVKKVEKGVPVYFGHTQTTASSTTSWSASFSSRPRGRKARPDFFSEFIRDEILRTEKMMNDAIAEELKKAQAEETLRAHGFAMPGDAEFMPPPPESTNARRAREQFDALHQMFREGKIKPDKAKRPKEE